MKEVEKIKNLHNELIRTVKIPFPKKGQSIDAPTKKGVYIIYNSKDQVIHVGRNKKAKAGLQQRLKNHLYGSSSLARNYLKPHQINLRAGYYYSYILVKDDRERALLEALSIGLLCPRYIGLN